MRLQKYIAITTAFISITAAASGDDCGLTSNSLNRQYTDLIQPANIMSDVDAFGNEDGRGTLLERQTDLGLTSAESKQIRTSTGYVICPASKGGNPIVISGALVGSNMQVVTASHAFIDEKGKKREPLSDCYFRNQDNPAQIVQFDFDSGTEKLGVTGVRGYEDPNDYAVVRLKSPVKDAIPFRADGQVLTKDESIIAVAAHQKSPTREFPSDLPVVQQCYNRETRTPNGAPAQYYTDCDASPIASGGVLLNRDSSGALAVKGIVVAGGKDVLNGQPYNISTGSYTRAIAINGSFGSDLASVRDSIPTQTATIKYP
jgi:hypothetical protein